ncbi:MAG: TIGR00730 family Rossman fold protein [Rhodospirillaceae bacterium]|jgi:uncharacterized protein (TIGR00730 family)|nr:TIGR00730 family Rossman fold protein [Rhodospirillaceae bacterium]
MADIRSVCLYCGSSSRVPESHKAAAIRLGALLGEASIRLIYGGGRVGLMGLAADGALSAGGEVVGIIPDFLDEREVGHPGLTELHVVDSMHARKQLMFEMADAFCILPGGIGTLDETFEILSWRQLGLHDKPILVVDQDGYWKPLSALLGHAVATGYVQPAHVAALTVVASVEDVPMALANAPDPRLPGMAGRL